MKPKPIVYITSISINDCIHQIAAQPWEFQSASNTELWYECSILSGSRIQITFKGGKFRKIVRTQYYIDFYKNGTTTIAVLNFCKELFGGWPATPLQDIDEFMKQKIFAVQNM